MIDFNAFSLISSSISFMEMNITKENITTHMIFNISPIQKALVGTIFQATLVYKKQGIYCSGWNLFPDWINSKKSFGFFSLRRNDSISLRRLFRRVFAGVFSLSKFQELVKFKFIFLPILGTFKIAKDFILLTTGSAMPLPNSLFPMKIPNRAVTVALGDTGGFTVFVRGVFKSSDFVCPRNLWRHLI